VVQESAVLVGESAQVQDYDAYVRGKREKQHRTPVEFNAAKAEARTAAGARKAAGGAEKAAGAEATEAVSVSVPVAVSVSAETSAGEGGAAAAAETGVGAGREEGREEGEVVAEPTTDERRAVELLGHCSMLVGIHPDQVGEQHESRTPTTTTH
jgi:hypothetical protein